MVTRGAKLLFRLALLLALMSVCLSAYLIVHAQSGPSWEVPVAVMVELQTLPPIAFLLAVVAVILYFWSAQAGAVGRKAIGGFWAVVVIALTLPVVIWLLRPEQWPFQQQMLSFCITVPVVLMALASPILFWLIGFRWVKAGLIL